MVRKEMLVFATILSLVFPMSLFSQSGNIDNITEAVNALKGINAQITKQEAFKYLKTKADKGNTYALNALGMAYMYGVGTDVDTVKAIHYLSKAGENGNVESYHNLGMMYKNGVSGVCQNFEQACHWFKFGADNGSVMCSYDLGFMLYKGLGCTQDYKKAMEYFHIAADHDCSPALYMLGLCLRNGYGTDKDEERATFYLKRAGELGNMAAWEELNREKPENNQDEAVSDNDYAHHVEPSTNYTSQSMANVLGKYQGYMILHDWSNQFVLGEKPIIMTIQKVKDKVACQMVVAKQSISFLASIDSLGSLKFNDSHINLKERYTGTNEGVDYLVKNIQLQLSDNTISGSLSLYSLLLQEPERPISLLLYKKSKNNTTLDAEEAKKFTRITVSPSPFTDSFTATFELQEKSENVVARFFNQSGMLLQIIKLGTLEEGKHSISISPKLGKGDYVLNIKAGKQILRSIITKK